MAGGAFYLPDGIATVMMGGVRRPRRTLQEAVEGPPGQAVFYAPSRRSDPASRTAVFLSKTGRTKHFRLHFQVALGNGREFSISSGLMVGIGMRLAEGVLRAFVPRPPSRGPSPSRSALDSAHL
jgi:hypothetical protein